MIQTRPCGEGKWRHLHHHELTDYNEIINILLKYTKVYVLLISVITLMSHNIKSIHILT